MWTNFHTHSNYCDGKSSVKEVVESAILKKMIGVGFSSHAPLPFAAHWCMKHENFPLYLQEIEELKKRWPSMLIYKGLEVDYIPGKISPSDFAKQLDYTIGSVHFVESFADGRGWEIDGTQAAFKEGYELIFKKNIHAVVARYFELTREMILKGSPDIIGHLDKIKMQNTFVTYFDESETWYRQEVLKTIDVIRSSPTIVEVNTRGLYQKKTSTTYPSPWVLAKLHEHNIPITLSSDAHHPDDLINQFAETAELLLSIGFKNLRILVDGRWQDLPFDQHGIKLN